MATKTHTKTECICIVTTTSNLNELMSQKLAVVYFDREVLG